MTTGDTASTPSGGPTQPPDLGSPPPGHGPGADLAALAPGSPPPRGAQPGSYPPGPYPPGPYPPGVWAHQPGAYQPGSWLLLPVPVARPPRPRRWRVWLVAALAVLLVGGIGGVGGLAWVASYAGQLHQSARWAAGTASAHAAPAANAPAAQWRGWVLATARDEARAQGDALVDGDQAGYLDIADPAEHTLVGELRRQFRVLRAMGIGAWRQTVTSSPESSGRYRWRLDLAINYCFGPRGCEMVRLDVRSEWVYKDDRLLLSDLGDSGPEWNGPRPWEVVDLKVAAGRRAVVAATKVNAWRLPEAIKAADAAAAVADRFAQWHDRPGLYVIFLAGPTDWNKWYGHEQPDWAAAWAVPVGTFATEVVVRTEVVRQSGLLGLLTHELTHVSTLAGRRGGADSAAWWLIEGIAEYAQFLGRPVRQYDALVPLRSFVRGSWDGDVAVTAPRPGASLREASGRYGVSFLAVRRIAGRYGEARMLDFFGRVVHSGESLDVAARASLGVSWPTVRTDCARFVRSAVA